MAFHLTAENVSLHIYKHMFLQQVPELAQHKQLYSWPAALAGSLRYDVTATNLSCMIMNKFPVYVFPCRVVDPAKLFIIINLYLNFQALL